MAPEAEAEVAEEVSTVLHRLTPQRVDMVVQLQLGTLPTGLVVEEVAVVHVP